jgi:hypothetical protein
MSNTLAIAATTATLRNLLLTEVPQLDTDLSDLEVTTQPLDLARKGITKSQLNLFLYHTAHNSAWRNFDIPRQVRPGETGAPPLALNLHYLITAYGRGENDADAVSHRVLGGAMSVLHDHTVLERSEISSAIANNDLADQFERVKITSLPVTVDELSKLWMIFQTQYRISAAYEVTVVLIDSRTKTRAPLPVLTRGESDRGVMTVAGTAPVLNEVRPPQSQVAARLGEDVVFAGKQLVVTNAILRFSSLRLPTAVEVAPASGTDAAITVHIPDQSEDADARSRWAPGYYTVALVVTPPGEPVRSSNEIAFALAPVITLSSTVASSGDVSLGVTCEPRIVAGQRALLLFGDRQIEPDAITNPSDATQPTEVTFTITDVDAGEYVVRLRVDGVDSIPAVYSGTPLIPSFDPLQKVTVS